jgi:REP element-mobilizing transposase RayT
VSYPLRDESPGYHHVVARGNNKRDIFLVDRDRWFFCLTVTRLARKYDWKILAHVLMRNHYHLLLEIGDLGLSAGMCELNTAHAVTFNAFHGRINHLFGKRYWSRYLMTDADVQNAARYIVQNPRRAGCKLPLEAHPWSSYAATVGASYPVIPLALDELLPFFGSRPVTAIEAFREFCRYQPAPTELEEPRPVAATVT